MKPSPLTNALIWIGVYVVSFSAADALSAQFGVEKLITAPTALLLSLIAWLYVRRTGQSAHYGLVSMKGLPLRRLLYLVPFAALASVNCWFGFKMQLTPAETALYMFSMLAVGFLEELIFRGFLFRALEKDGLVQAIVISGVTFGLGHIVNLINGAELLPTMLQLIYAIAIGLCFTVFFHRTGCLVPCILCHSLTNMLSALAAEPSVPQQIAACLFLVVVSGGYTLWLLRLRPQA